MANGTIHIGTRRVAVTILVTFSVSVKDLLQHDVVLSSVVVV